MTQQVCQYSTPIDHLQYNSNNIIDYNKETDRYESFKRCTHLKNAIIENASTFAMLGLFYNQTYDKIQCFFCKTKFNITDNVTNELHLSKNSSCPLLRHQKTNNIPIDDELLKKNLPKYFSDKCGSGKLIFHKYPEMCSSADRRETFEDWEFSHIQEPRGLVDAGLFYLGEDDQVVCYSCGIGLKDWDKNDIPFEEHARFANKCQFLIERKGREYEELIKIKYDRK